MDTSPVITMPENKEWQRQLWDKLADYDQRVSDGGAGMYSPPEIYAAIPAYYAQRILRTLLDNGSVETWVLARQMAKELEDWFDVEYFEHYCRVIDRYCREGVKICQ